jgi:hypothetical protein
MTCETTEETIDYRKKKSSGSELIDAAFSLTSIFYYLMIIGSFAFSSIILVKLFPEYIGLIVAFMKCFYWVLLVMVFLFLFGLILEVIGIFSKASDKNKQRQMEANEFRLTLMERLNDIEDKLNKRRNK